MYFGRFFLFSTKRKEEERKEKREKPITDYLLPIIQYSIKKIPNHEFIILKNSK